MSSDALTKVVSVMIRVAECRPQKGAPCALAEMKSKQCTRIGELRQALMASGFYTLDEQARALGLCRSTTWALLRANHKASGLSATLINRMWVAPQLPEAVRAKILQYVEEKVAGIYGHNVKQRRKFTQQLSIEVTRHVGPSMGSQPFLQSPVTTIFAQ
jgi:hypothetical protein